MGFIWSGATGPAAAVSSSSARTGWARSSGMTVKPITAAWGTYPRASFKVAWDVDGMFVAERVHVLPGSALVVASP